MPKCPPRSISSLLNRRVSCADGAKLSRRVPLGNVSRMRVPYNKLVRDRIPEIIKADGRQPVTRILDQAGYQAALVAKLLEEAQEASAAHAANLPAELADVLEVLQALVCTLGMTWEDFLSLTARKRAERGGFSDRIYLEYVEQRDIGPGHDA